MWVPVKFNISLSKTERIVWSGTSFLTFFPLTSIDIFFGKFSDLISLKPVSENVEIKSEVEISREKKPLNKILIFSSVVIILGIVIYYFS